jgi:alanyl-tRNA synthetase
MSSGLSAAEIRRRFLTYFKGKDHVIRPSASLVPSDDPTLLFTNAGMVPFKRIFLGLERPEFGPRATTSQKCVRAGGKHNDLEQVGHTTRHHTFFEMLGNFSFGDYFKREAIGFAWEFVTGELGIPREHLRVTVYRTDAEARALWQEIAGLPDSRIYGLGDADNFWQMADTGPCGPCTEIYVDLAHAARDWQFPAGASGEWTDARRTEFTEAAFVEGAEAGRFLEIWNLVFMQYDRQPDGTLVPLPKPSVDTGAGLERIAAVMQGVSNNFDTDLFMPLLNVAAGIFGEPAHGPARASYRVLADHARAVAFLLADGVFPSNEGRGYVLRRILRRAVRHAWLIGHTPRPALVPIVGEVIKTMGDAYPELKLRQKHLLETTRAEEERFLETIEAGMRRFDQIAPVATTHGSAEIRGTVSGEDAFRLYDTFGFPIDLTELMARERGYTVDTAGFERALEGQRTQSKEDRRSRKLGVAADELDDLDQWEWVDGGAREASPEAFHFVGYDVLDTPTRVAARRTLNDGRTALILFERPFYVESGGQISDRGEVVGDGWRLDVEEVRKVAGRVAVVGRLTGSASFGDAVARVPRDARQDTERNHTATHLLHAALRSVLGEHVHQRGSLVAPDRLRFDFSHPGPMGPEAIAEVTELVNREIARALPVSWVERRYADAVAGGAMALFGEKYGDIVRVVTVPGFSQELCGGTHVRNTSEILLFAIVSETGVGSGTRRIEAVTGRVASARARAFEHAMVRVAEVLRVSAADPTVVATRVEQMAAERRALEKQLADSVRSGAGDGGRFGDYVRSLLSEAIDDGDFKIISVGVKINDINDLQEIADVLRERLGSGIGVLAAPVAGGKATLLVIVTDDLRARGVRADAIVREVAATVGGKGGGKPHMAQAGLPDATQIDAVVEQAVPIVRAHIRQATTGSAA